MSTSEHTLAERLRADVEAICLPRGRVVGTPGHDEARRILRERLRGIGAEPWSGSDVELPYQDRGGSFCNLIGVFRGRNGAGAPLLVGAHYDSAIPGPSADDNAAAVAIALAVAEQVGRSRTLARDLVVAIFDAEEPPYFLSRTMGSVQFYEEQRDGRPIHAALIMDLVGHDVSVGRALPDAADVLAPMLFMTGAESHPGLRGVLERLEGTGPLSVVPTLNRYPGDMSDHAVFRARGVPYFFLSCGRWAHYHRMTDTPDRLNYRKMARITQHVLELLQGLDATDLPQRGEEQFAETLDLEVAWMQRAFGPLWGPVLHLAGVTRVAARADMDRVASAVLGLGL